MTAPQDPFAAPDPHATPSQPPVEHPRPYGQAIPAGTRNGLGTAALVLGILSVALFFTIAAGIVLGGLAIALGIAGRGRAGKGQATNRGTATAGLWLGVAGAVISLAILAAGVLFLQSDRGTRLRDCLEGAQTTEQQAECQREFADELSR